jgi:preprotein translocase subunit SecA
MAQRDPLVEYQREGYGMFQTMMEGIREESVAFLYNLEVQPAEATVEAGQPPAPGLEAPAQPTQLQYTAPAEDGSTETHIEQARSAKTAQNGSRGTRKDATGPAGNGQQQAPRRAKNRRR